MAALPQVGTAWALITGERQAGAWQLLPVVQVPCWLPCQRQSLTLPHKHAMWHCRAGTSLARAIGRDAGVCGAPQLHLTVLAACFHDGLLLYCPQEARCLCTTCHTAR